MTDLGDHDTDPGDHDGPQRAPTCISLADMYLCARVLALTAHEATA